MFVLLLLALCACMKIVSCVLIIVHLSNKNETFTPLGQKRKYIRLSVEDLLGTRTSVLAEITVKRVCVRACVVA